MNFLGGAKSRGASQSEDRTYAGGIAWGPLETDPQTGPGSDVLEDTGLGAVLCHHQVHPTVFIEVAYGSPSLFAIDLYPETWPATDTNPPFPSPRNHNPRPASRRSSSG